MSSEKRIYGLIGCPVKHSLSAVMHNAAFKYLKEYKEIDYDAEYRLFEVKPQDLESFLLGSISVKDTEGKVFLSKDIVGFNITIPHKVRVKEILENKLPFDNNRGWVEEDLYYVRLSGAINTIKRNGDKLDYWNTDAEGFSRSLEEDLKFNTKDKNVLLVGCGGAGRAIIASLSWKETGINKIYINDINVEARDSTKEHFLQASKHLKDFSINRLQFISREEIVSVVKNCDLLINASPIGMKENDSLLIEKSFLHKNLSVYDVVYNRETQLIREANSLGLVASNGLRMLLYQGMFSFEHWTGKKAPKEVMWEALSSQISTK